MGGEESGGLPGHGEGRDDLVADLDGGHFAAGLDYGADEFVAHYEACRGGLVAAVDVEFAGGLTGRVRFAFDMRDGEGDIRAT